MKKKAVIFLKKTRKKISKYLSTNRLFLTFVIFGLIETVLIRHFTVVTTGEYKPYEPFICDLALLIIIGAFGYFAKPKKQFNYYFVWLLIISLMCIVNSVYYVFYTSFASFSLLAEIGLVGEVGDSVIEKFRIIDFIYVLFPIFYVFIHTVLKKGNYYVYVGKVENGKKMFTSTILVGVIIFCFTLVNITGTDISRLVKLWNRELVVQRFGIVLYQGNDLVQSLAPKINSLFGYDEAAKSFKEYYGELWANKEDETNRFTGVFEGMNVIFIHMESIQNFLVDMKVNGQEITPTINRLSKEGMYFNNFFPQISVGTSSDTEFTLNSSLMPSSSGTVFVRYWERNYVTIPKLLKEKGYYTFSSHANGDSMWNRRNMHPSLGYDDMIFKKEFDVGDKSDPRWLGLGLSDYDFFLQLQEKLEKIETEHENYMGTLIQLSNHSPFYATEFNPELYNYFGKLDLTNTYKKKDEVTNKETVVTDDYLEGTELGDYLVSAHYADMALGTFFDYVRNSPYYNNTVFVLYGDHDARIGKNEYRYYYNYNIETGEVYEEGDLNYVNYDNFAHEINKKTPLIIWTKNEKVAKNINLVNSNVMGMYDIMPTLGNMFNFENKYALGHDIFSIKENNVVVFPNGNFVTNKLFYINTSNSYMPLITQETASNTNPNGNSMITSSIIIDENYIDIHKKYVDDVLSVSNSIIVHNLIEREGDNIIVEDKEGN